jgi:hypothetical protein
MAMYVSIWHAEQYNTTGANASGSGKSKDKKQKKKGQKTGMTALSQAEIDALFAR